MKINNKEKKIDFFDGPMVYLTSLRDPTYEGHNVALEDPKLVLQLAPTSWYQYAGCNSFFREKSRNISAEEYIEITGIEKIIQERNFDKNQLPSILDMAITIITIDGYILYGKRGRDITLPNRLTSIVAENINRFLDDTKLESSTQLINPLATWNDEKSKDKEYQPTGVPHPFAAAIRGIKEELSPSLLCDPRIQPTVRSALKITGVSFDLDSCHPDLLFCLPISLSLSEIKILCDQNPGEHKKKEVIMLATKADWHDPATQEVLKDPLWIPGGHASVVRTLALLHELRKDMTYDQAFEFIASKT